MKDARGFSLIEVMIVVTVIAVLAGLAIPNLVLSRAAADEGSAIASVRTIGTAQIAYLATGNDRFGRSMSELQSEGFIDNSLGSGQKDGYQFETQGATVNFTVTATPASIRSGARSFFMDESGVIRYALTGVAGPDSPALGSDSSGGGDEEKGKGKDKDKDKDDDEPED